MISTQNFRVEHGLQIGDVVIDAASGIVSATSFVGDGSGLTGISGGGDGESYWVSTLSGIHTTSNVGIGTTNPQTKLEISGVLGFGTFDNSGTRTNIRIGDNTTGANITDGYDNIFMGIGAGNFTTTGSCNNFFGPSAGRGKGGIIIGYGNLSSTTLVEEANNNYSNVSATGGSGFNAIFFVERNGSGAPFISITSGGYDYNVGDILTIDGASVGGSSGTDDVIITVDSVAVEGSSGSNNNFFGAYAGRCNTTGSFNNFFGYFAGFCNNNGSCNNFIGYKAGEFNTSGYDNNFIGWQAGRNNTTGSYNNFFGEISGRFNSSGSYNNFFGNAAGNFNTTGDRNNFIGDCAGRYNTTGSYNNFFGWGSGFLNTIGEYNQFFGAFSGRSNTTGFYNNFFGKWSGYCNTTGSNNIYLGSHSGLSTSSSKKVIIGSGSPYRYFDSPDTNKDTQLAIGVRDAVWPANDPSRYWIVGDENFNVGIGTTDPISKLTVVGDVLVSGVVTATSFIGDGSGLTNLPTPSRTTVTGITTIISSGGIGNTDISGFKTYILLKVGISTEARIRIYTDSDSRSNDASRPINIDPTSGSGIVAEFVSVGATTIKTGPSLIGYNDDDPEENIIYMSVNNLSGISTSIEVNLTILKMEE